MRCKGILSSKPGGDLAKTLSPRVMSFLTTRNGGDGIGWNISTMELVMPWPWGSLYPGRGVSYSLAVGLVIPWQQVSYSLAGG